MHRIATAAGSSNRMAPAGLTDPAHQVVVVVVVVDFVVVDVEVVHVHKDK